MITPDQAVPRLIEQLRYEHDVYVTFCASPGPDGWTYDLLDRDSRSPLLENATGLTEPHAVLLLEGALLGIRMRHHG